MPTSLALSSSTGSRLAALEWEGDPGRSFLLVHGLSSNARTWRGVAEVLSATGHRVVAVDQRSHGASEVTNDGYDFATLAADLRATIEQTGLDRPVLAGQSWGGNVVVETASRHSDTVSAVVGVDGGHIQLTDRFPTWEECARTLAPPRFAGMHAEELETYLRAAHPDWSDEGISDTLANVRPDGDGGVRPNLPFDKHMLILRQLYAHRPSELMANLTMPSLLLAARSPEIDIGSDTGFDEIVVIDGDHDLHVQQPDVVALHLDRVAPWA